MVQNETQCERNKDDLVIVLGTSSMFRRTLFAEHFPRLPFIPLSPSIDEKAIRLGNSSRQDSDPHALTLAIAHAKADALVDKVVLGTVLITSDQIVLCNGFVREKPESEEQCRQFLQDYRKFPLQTVTAVVVTVVNEDGNSRFEGVDIATQKFSTIPNAVIDQLIKKGDVMYCAGGITVEDELLAPYLGERDGSLESIMGLPLVLVDRLMKAAGVNTYFLEGL